jgi:hypothetical protein
MGRLLALGACFWLQKLPAGVAGFDRRFPLPACFSASPRQFFSLLPASAFLPASPCPRVSAPRSPLPAPRFLPLLLPFLFPLLDAASIAVLYSQDQLLY